MYKLGKAPATPRKTDFKLKNYEVALPPLPTKSFGYGTRLSDWKMLGNDRAGDCVFAGAAHETMLWGWLRSSHPILPFDDTSVLSDYSAVTGYDPDNPDTDQGTNVHDAMSYRRNTGIRDTAGVRHKIDAYISIDPGNFDLMLRCVWTFGTVGIGFNFPDSAWSQFDNDKVWDVVSGAKVDGGHYVPMVGSQNPAKEASFVTWGRRARMTKAFYQKYNDEAWVPLSREMMHSSGLNWRHLDWEALKADLNSL